MRSPFSVYPGMGRQIRFIPAGSAVEVTSRTLEGRLFLTPSEELNQIIEGCLACSGKLYPVDIHAYAFMSNHFHLLLTVPDAHRLAAFMGHFKSKLAREVNRLRGRQQMLWGGRYSAIVVSGEEAAQLARLRYILAHGCKEGFVSRPQDWPGAHAARALENYPQSFLEGTWINRTRQWRQSLDEAAVRERVALALQPLPCWKDLPPEQIRGRVRELLAEIEAETARMHRQRATRPTGRRAILSQDQGARPYPIQRSPTPKIHAVARRIRQQWNAARRVFNHAYRQASERLRRGDRTVEFPPGSFPPALPFVTVQARAAPG